MNHANVKRHVRLTISATAGNVQTNLTPGDNKRWTILNGVFSTVNDATVTTRFLIIRKNTSAGIGTGVIAVGCISLATETKNISLASEISVPFGTSTWTSVVDIVLSIGQWIVELTDKINITLQNGVAGDSYSGYLDVLEESC